MGDTSVLCVCGHTQGQHEGLQRKCLTCANLPNKDCPAFLSVAPAVDAVNHPPHYNAHPSGVECITVVEHMGFNVGNAIKYLWRADLKGNALEDLKKAAWYVAREIERRTKAGG